MKAKLVSGVFGAALLSAATAWAQQDPVALVPMNNWSYQHHSSTADEGYLRGAGALVQSAGQANYANSLAAVNFAEAYRRQIENSRLYVQVYLERREMVRAYLNKYGNHPPTKEQLERVAQAALPDRLSNEEYDPASGKLVWPHILRDESYAAFREKIDQLMAVRTPDNSGDGSPWQREMALLVDSLKRTLKQNIDTVTPQQYARAKWFLLSLDYEAKQIPGKPVSVPVVASQPQPAAVAAQPAADAAKPAEATPPAVVPVSDPGAPKRG
ncbi:MAG: hypothetical protein U0892_20865 [Pirellulales bacterium]